MRLRTNPHTHSDNRQHYHFTQKDFKLTIQISDKLNADLHIYILQHENPGTAAYCPGDNPTDTLRYTSEYYTSKAAESIIAAANTESSYHQVLRNESEKDGA